MSGDLAAFLLARIADDEQWSTFGCVDEHEGLLANPSCRDRVLAECEAKRRIVALHRAGPMLDHYEFECTCGYADHQHSECQGCGYVLHDEGEFDRKIRGRTCPTLRLLAAPYAGHSDFDPAWRL